MGYLILATGSSAVMAIVMKIFRDPKGNRYGIILGNYLVCILVSFLRLPDHAQVFRGSAVTVLLGVISGAAYVAGLVTIQTSTKLNGATLTAVFAKMGLVISLAVSILVFGERPGPLQLAGLLLVVPAIVLINSGPGESERAGGEKPHTGALLLTMLAGGVSSIMSKVFEQAGPRAEDELYFLYLFAAAAVLTGLLCIVEKRRTGLSLRGGEMAAGIAVGIPNYYASFLLLMALVALPAFIVYPVSSAGSILIVMAAGRFFFHETHTRKQMIGILLVLAAVVLLNLS